MMIFHSYVKLPEGILGPLSMKNIHMMGIWVKDGQSLFLFHVNPGLTNPNRRFNWGAGTTIWRVYTIFIKTMVYSSGVSTSQLTSSERPRSKATHVHQNSRPVGTTAGAHTAPCRSVASRGVMTELETCKVTRVCTGPGNCT